MFRIAFLTAALTAALCVQADSTDIRTMLNTMDEIVQDPSRYEAALVAGAERTVLCVHCHGTDGNSKREYIPNLANQNAGYLFTQFEYFANGTRKDYVMSKLAQGLTKEDKIAIALYFSKQPVTKREATPPSSANGERIYKSVCFACHGAKGHGDTQYPRIAGQPYEFLEKTLLRFHDNADERKNSPMTGVVRNMKEAELRDVASFVANMD